MEVASTTCAVTDLYVVQSKMPQIEVKWKLQDVAVPLLVDRMKDSKQHSKWEWSKSDDQEIQTGVTKWVECKDEEKNATNKQKESSPKVVFVTIGTVCRD